MKKLDKSKAKYTAENTAIIFVTFLIHKELATHSDEAVDLIQRELFDNIGSIGFFSLKPLSSVYLRAALNSNRDKTPKGLFVDAVKSKKNTIAVSIIHEIHAENDLTIGQEIDALSSDYNELIANKAICGWEQYTFDDLSVEISFQCNNSHREQDIEYYTGEAKEIFLAKLRNGEYKMTSEEDTSFPLILSGSTIVGKVKKEAIKTQEDNTYTNIKLI